jgi:hypothetical protein
VERAERSGGLHKRSAEAWGHPLRARGAELPLGAFVVALGFQRIRPALQAEIRFLWNSIPVEALVILILARDQDQQ